MAVGKLLRDKLCRDITRFFHDNQSSIDTPRGIATWVKEERAAVKKALDKLTAAGVLLDHRVSSTTGYSYTRDRKLIREIDKQLKNKR